MTRAPYGALTYSVHIHDTGGFNSPLASSTLFSLVFAIVKTSLHRRSIRGAGRILKEDVVLEEGEDDDVAAAATFWSSRFDAELNFSGVPLSYDEPII